MCECDQYATGGENPGRWYELCTGRSHSHRPAPPLSAANAWRAQHRLGAISEPLDAVAPSAVGQHWLRDTKETRIARHTVASQVPAVGPGSELKSLFLSLGLKLPGCEGCKGTVKRMNLAGISGCREQREAFVAEIKTRAKSVPLSTWAAAAANGLKLALTTGLAVNPLDPIPGLFDEAVRRADAKQRSINSYGA